MSYRGVPRPKPKSNLRTFSHLADRARIPSEYELTTTNLFHHFDSGFEMNASMKNWYDRYQRQSPLSCSTWESFVDPRETTYTKYTALQSKREVFVDGLLQTIEDTGYDAELSREWIDTFSRVVAPLRYPFHGFQMISAYIGQLAPTGRIAIAALFQTADEVRRIQRIAYRMTQLASRRNDMGPKSRFRWEKDSAWQPLRAAVEKLLVTYDWGEALVAFNLCLKPIIDELCMSHFVQFALPFDHHSAAIFQSLRQDCDWQRAWTESVLDLALRDTPANRPIVQRWVDEWAPRSLAAADSLTALFSRDTAEISAAIRGFHRDQISALGLESRP